MTEGDIQEIARMWEYPQETTIDKAYEALNYMEATHSKNRQKQICHLCLGVFQREQPNVIIGWCGLDGEAEIGKTVLFYMIDEKYRNRGYATQCAVELINYAFKDMAYDIIYGGCAKNNAGSYRVMQKAGMIQNSFNKNGDHIFSIDRDQFLNAKKYLSVREKRDMSVEVRFYDEVEDQLLKFAVIIARSGGKWVFCRHRERTTLEIPGGRREPGESVEEAARRELYEETGAKEFSIWPVCVYSVVRDDAEESLGGLYAAEIFSFEKELHSEIERIVMLEELPEDNWTYPEIQPKLMEEARKRGVSS
ncbi:MAG: GNAT family N-acetyltransferase [Oscillospiraceae bacterium]|nr:GNAT family N-acetyltransferase [Oscillospiraceae bacterium]